MTCHLPHIAAVAAASGRCITSAPRQGSATEARSTHAAPMPTPPESDGASYTPELQSIRRRLSAPEPGTVNALRARQRIALHQILASNHSSDRNF